MKIAIVADWLPTYGGAEHVIASLVRQWPTAPIFTTIAAPKNLGPLASADIRTDQILQRFFRWFGRHEILLPWMPRAIERMRLEGYDMVLSSSHAVGKGIIVPPGTVHVCYCHTPMRYAWEMEHQYLKDFRLRGFVRYTVQKILRKLRRWDLSTAKRVDHFIANSSETQARIRRTYGRESVVISPPVEDRFFKTQLKSRGSPAFVSSPPSPLQNRERGDASRERRGEGKPYFLALGRLVPYKRFDLLIELSRRLGFTLKIAGTGPEMAHLKSLAEPSVEFLGFVSDDDLPLLYSDAEALLFPQMEDAGIVPMEAQASGVPVIAYGKGGVLDVVVPQKTGVFAEEQTVESFGKALEEFRRTEWNRASIRDHARQFQEATFQARMVKEISSAYQKYTQQKKEA